MIWCVCMIFYENVSKVILSYVDVWYRRRLIVPRRDNSFCVGGWRLCLAETTYHTCVPVAYVSTYAYVLFLFFSNLFNSKARAETFYNRSAKHSLWIIRQIFSISWKKRLENAKTLDTSTCFNLLQSRADLIAHSSPIRERGDENTARIS